MMRRLRRVKGREQEEGGGDFDGLSGGGGEMVGVFES